MPAKIYLVSACLLGINSRYDGGDNRSEKVLEFLKGRHAVPVCPEQLGGCPLPAGRRRSAAAAARRFWKAGRRSGARTAPTLRRLLFGERSRCCGSPG